MLLFSMFGTEEFVGCPPSDEAGFGNGVGVREHDDSGSSGAPFAYSRMRRCLGHSGISDFHDNVDGLECLL